MELSRARETTAPVFNVTSKLVSACMSSLTIAVITISSPVAKVPEFGAALNPVSVGAMRSTMISPRSKKLLISVSAIKALPAISTASPSS